MRAILSLLFFLMVLILNTNAQPLAWAFPDSGIVWCQSWSWGNFRENYGGIEHQIFADGNDTIINGVQYHKLLHTGYGYSSIPGQQHSSFTKEYFGSFRNDTLKQQVEFRNTWGNSILYNFNLDVGDTLTFDLFPGFQRTVIDSIDTIWLGGLSRRIYFYSAGYVGYLIEGIGPHTGLGERAFSGDLDYSASLNCFTIYDSTYRGSDSSPASPPAYEPSCNWCRGSTVTIPTLSHNNSITLSPNPASDKLILTPVQPCQNASLQLLNIHGQLVYSEKLQQAETDKTININSLTPGTYFALVQTDFGSSISKLMIIR